MDLCRRLTPVRRHAANRKLCGQLRGLPDIGRTGYRFFRYKDNLSRNGDAPRGLQDQFLRNHHLHTAATAVAHRRALILNRCRPMSMTGCNSKRRICVGNTYPVLAWLKVHTKKKHGEYETQPSHYECKDNVLKIKFKLCYYQTFYKHLNNSAFIELFDFRRAKLLLYLTKFNIC